MSFRVFFGALSYLLLASTTGIAGSFDRIASPGFGVFPEYQDEIKQAKDLEDKIDRLPDLEVELLEFPISMFSRCKNVGAISYCQKRNLSIRVDQDSSHPSVRNQALRDLRALDADLFKKAPVKVKINYTYNLDGPGGDADGQDIVLNNENNDFITSNQEKNHKNMIRVFDLDNLDQAINIKWKAGSNNWLLVGKEHRITINQITIINSVKKASRKLLRRAERIDAYLESTYNFLNQVRGLSDNESQRRREAYEKFYETAELQTSVLTNPELVAQLKKPTELKKADIEFLQGSGGECQGKSLNGCLDFLYSANFKWLGVQFTYDGVDIIANSLSSSADIFREARRLAFEEITSHSILGVGRDVIAGLDYSNGRKIYDKWSVRPALFYPYLPKAGQSSSGDAFQFASCGGDAIDGPNRLINFFINDSCTILNGFALAGRPTVNGNLLTLVEIQESFEERAEQLYRILEGYSRLLKKISSATSDDINVLMKELLLYKVQFEYFEENLNYQASRIKSLAEESLNSYPAFSGTTISVTALCSNRALKLVLGGKNLYYSAGVNQGEQPTCTDKSGIPAASTNFASRMKFDELYTYYLRYKNWAVFHKGENYRSSGMARIKRISIKPDANGTLFITTGKDFKFDLRVNVEMADNKVNHNAIVSVLMPMKTDRVDYRRLKGMVKNASWEGSSLENKLFNEICAKRYPQAKHPEIQSSCRSSMRSYRDSVLGEVSDAIRYNIFGLFP